MTFPNVRDCEHGHQRGKCEICELKEQLAEARADLPVMVLRLEAELKEARKALLEKGEIQ